MPNIYYAPPRSRHQNRLPVAPAPEQSPPLTPDAIRELLERRARVDRLREHGHHGNVFINCTTSDCGGDGFRLAGNEYLEDCTARDNDGNGFTLDHATDVTIINAESERNKGHGLAAVNSEAEIDDARIARNAKGAIRNDKSKLRFRRGKISD